MSLKKMSIEKADGIVKYYSEILTDSKGILNIEEINDYDIRDVSNALKILVAYKIYNGQINLEQIKKYAHDADASLMHYHIGFCEQSSEKEKLYISKDTMEYMQDSINRCFDNDEVVSSFFDYCLEVRSDNPDFWELIFSRINIIYDINDNFLAEYFNKSIYNKSEKNRLLEYLLLLELGKKAIDKNDLDLAMELLTKAYDGFRDLKEIYKNHANLYYYIGYIEYLAGEDKNYALLNFGKAIQIDANHAFSFFYRAALHMRFGNKEKAIYDLIKAKELGINRAENIRINYEKENHLS